ncbi:MAG: AMP-binding protein [Pseudonocardia sp.]|uniref:class I adenylate-forming enzyme family protein n=1 Tax=unclassified Pseudonocardia TaxID=2619320 RepID=UPI00086E93BF|nr:MULTISPECIES: AMP-binding protein [unclassified Pseudonocardia]MBN9112058.1 AMP-binding protein [Pseudonocardia sp.]ODU26179.1 MAG: AMP-dependent synthetase [Pseudonocardia sp. SCN 72-51]ODV06022.1 MAG: AMP-dependent synthetase [Pseudonocardia sp. SCN 73-27]
MDVPGLMRQSMRFHARRTALVTRDRTLTFAQAWDRGVRVANDLRALGVGPGDRVAAVEDNTLGAADLFLGAAIAGAVRVPLYPRNSRRSHEVMIAQTGARVVIAEAAHADGVLGLEREIDGLDHVVVRDDGYEERLAAQSDVDPTVQVRADDWYVIRHSSGTTGRPKGVGYTQHEWLVNCRNWFYRLPRLGWDSVVGHAAPISHAAGYLFLPAWLAGATNLLYGPFDVPTVLEMTERHRVTHTFAAPSMLAALAADPGASGRDWSALRCILVGGAPITDATITAGRRVFGDVVHQVFGQTEATPLTIGTPDEWFADVPGSTPMRSAGRVLPFCRLEIRGSDGTVLDTGAEGEIWTQVEAQMHGYWGDPERTAERLVDGWVRTGDIGRLDENGFLYVLDRVDDMIVSGGFNIWPAEVETVIAGHPDVVEVAVFGIPHTRWGETPMAVCCIRPDATVTEQEIVDLVATRLGRYQKPTTVQLTTEPLPKSVVGKLQRKVLRTPFWEGHEARVSGA